MSLIEEARGLAQHVERCESSDAHIAVGAKLTRDDWVKVYGWDALMEAIAEIDRLRSFLEQTADGQLVRDCEHLYCPHCGEEVRQDPFNCMCDNCGNPDSYGEPPLPLFYSMCMSKPKDE